MVLSSESILPKAPLPFILISMLMPSTLKRSSGPALLLCVLLIFAFYDVVFLGKTFKITTANSQALSHGPYGQADNRPKWIPVNGTDAPVSEEPIYEFIKQNLNRGILPLWNPHQACGYALIGMLEVGIFYPLNLILYLLPNIIAWDLLIFARLFFAGLFTFLFMRQLGFKNTPALSAAIVFMLSGPMILLQYWTANVDLLAPLLLLVLDKLVKKTSLRAMCLAAIVVALTIFAGHPEHVFLVNAYGLAFFIFRTVTLQKPAQFGKIFLLYTGAYALGIGLAAIVFFPFVRNFAAEFWHGHPDGTGLLMEEQRDRAITLALPHFFQIENLKYNFTFAGWWGGYLGTLPLAFASLGLFKKQEKGLNYFFLAMAVLIIGKEYGLPVINWLGYLPIFDTCRYAIHTPPLAALTVAILCGMGAHAVRVDKKSFRKGLVFTGLLLVMIVIHLFVLRRTEYFPFAERASLFALFVLTIFQTVLWLKDKNILQNKALPVVIIAMIFAELFLYIHRERPRRFDSFGKVPYIEFLKTRPEPVRSYGEFWAFYPNTATGFEVDDLGYFLGLVPSRYVDYVNAVLRPGQFKNDLRPPALRAMPIERSMQNFLDILNVRFIVAPSEEQLKKLVTNSHLLYRGARPVYSDEVRVFERPTALPRAYVVHRAVFQPDKEQAFKLMKMLGPNIREGAVIDHVNVPNIVAELNELPVKDRSTAAIERMSANEVIVNARMENPGFVVLSDAYHPDWRAFIDGVSTKVYQTNYLVRSVYVPKGEHTIRFAFLPFSFYLGAFASLMSLLALFILLKK